MYHGVSIGMVLPSRSLLGLDALAAVALRAEAGGVDVLYLNESGNDALTAAAALLGRTSAIGVATGIINTGVRHPFTVGMAAAELEALAPGRFRLGLGVGSESFNVQAIEQSLGAPIARLAEYATVVRGVACGTLAVPHTGAYPVRRVDRHAPAAAAVRIDAAALRPAAIRALSPTVDGFLVNFLTPATLRLLVGTVTPARRFAAYVQLVTSGRASAASARAEAAVLLSRYGAHVHYRRAFRLAGFEADADAIEAAYAAGTPPERAVSSELVDSMISVDDAGARARALVAEGAQAVILYPTPADGDWDRAFTETIAHAAALKSSLAA